MIRIIIVDDEILSRIGLQSFLDGKEGIVVSGIFGEAEEALHFLEENMVDVVLTDIEMADMDGLEFIRCAAGNLHRNGQLYPEAQRNREISDTGSKKCL